MLHFANVYCCAENFTIIGLRDNREAALPLSLTSGPIEIQHCTCLSHCYICSNRDRETALQLSCSLLHYTNRDRETALSLSLLLLHLPNIHRETVLSLSFSLRHKFRRRFSVFNLCFQQGLPQGAALYLCSNACSH